jgi:hypothetical protein
MSSISFSIVIPCYPPHFCHLQSLLQNINEFVIEDSYEIKEIIIAASSTHNLSLDTSCSKIPIKILTTHEFCNASRNRNRAWNHVEGNYIMFMDADDVYHPDKCKVSEEVILDLQKEQDFEVKCLVHSYHYKTAPNDWNLAIEKFKTVTNNTIQLITNVHETSCINAGDDMPIAHGITCVKKTVSSRFNESLFSGEDGRFCQSIVYNEGGMVAINAKLMIYR